MASVEGSVLPFLGLPTPLWAFGKGHFSAAPRAAGGERLIPGSSSNSSLHCAWAFSTERNVSHPESVLRASGAERVDTARICGGPNGFSGFLQNDAGPPLAISLRHTHIPVRGSAVTPQGARLASGQRGADRGEEGRRLTPASDVAAASHSGRTTQAGPQARTAGLSAGPRENRSRTSQWPVSHACGSSDVAHTLARLWVPTMLPETRKHLCTEPVSRGRPAAGGPCGDHGSEPGGCTQHRHADSQRRCRSRA